jgi:hypothetical protein
MLCLEIIIEVGESVLGLHNTPTMKPHCQWRFNCRSPGCSSNLFISPNLDKGETQLIEGRTYCFESFGDILNDKSYVLSETESW